MGAGISFSLLGAIHYLTDQNFKVIRVANGLHYSVVDPEYPLVTSICDRKALTTFAAEVCRKKHEKAAYAAIKLGTHEGHIRYFH